MKVMVTQRDIDRGELFDPQRCPIARALRRKCRKGYIEVTRGRIEVGGALYKPSRAAVRFMSYFDSEVPVAPSTFILRPVP